MRIDTVIIDPLVTLRKVISMLNSLDLSAEPVDRIILISSPTGVISGMIIATDNDQGISFNYNYIEPPVAGSTHGDPTLHQIIMRYETDGSWSLTYAKPDTVPAGIWDGPGKSIAIYPGGMGAAATSQFTDVLTTQAARILRFGSCVTDDNPTWGLQLDAGSDANNPTWIMVGGVMRKVIVDGGGFLKAV